MMRGLVLGMSLLLLPATAFAVAGDVNQPDVCYLCHDTAQAEQSMPSVHTAFADGNCSNCHNPHASRHAALLTEGERDLCIQCHEDIGVASFDEGAHGPVSRGECASCHDPHASDHPGQLHQPLVDQCSECHGSVSDWLARPVIHAPVSDGECGTCHDPHGSAHPALLSGKAQEVCLSCHASDAGMTAAHGSPAIANSNCTACHDPHSSTRAGLLRENEHGPFESGNCATCHGDLSNRQDFTVAEIRPLCERCHVATKQFADFPYTHNLDAPESCVQCHNPHASNVGSLLNSGTADLCSGCHFNEPDREKARSEYVTHVGMECTACHVAHGSVNPQYLKTTGSELCSACHERAHKITHPVGPEVIDPRTEQSVTCLSCHQLHGADFAQYIPLDPTRDLCIQCHRR